MPDNVRYYTTEVSPEKSLQEVMGLLRKVLAVEEVS